MMQLVKFSRERAAELHKLDEWFISKITPLKHDSLEMKMELDFEKLCHFLTDYTTINPKKMTVKEFYSLLSVVDKKKPRNLF